MASKSAIFVDEFFFSSFFVFVHFLFLSKINMTPWLVPGERWWCVCEAIWWDNKSFWFVYLVKRPSIVQWVLSAMAMPVRMERRAFVVQSKCTFFRHFILWNISTFTRNERTRYLVEFICNVEAQRETTTTLSFWCDGKHEISLRDAAGHETDTKQAGEKWRPKKGLSKLEKNLLLKIFNVFFWKDFCLQSAKHDWLLCFHKMMES